MSVPKVNIDWESITNKKRKLTVYNNARENKNRIDHAYNIGDKVLILIQRNEIQAKLKRPTKGPYRITKVYNNGSAKIRQGRYKEIINIRRIKPYHTQV